MGEFFSFLGASIIVAPLTFVVVFGIYWLLGKTELSAVVKLLAACVVAAATFAYLFSIRRTGRVSYEPQVWIVIWCAVGLISPRRDDKASD